MDFVKNNKEKDVMYKNYLETFDKGKKNIYQPKIYNFFNSIK